jgi:hypothetical protein
VFIGYESSRIALVVPRHLRVAANKVEGQCMDDDKPTYRIKISKHVTPQVAFGWEIYRNGDVLPFLRSQQFFISRMAVIADANRSKAKLMNAGT